MSTFKARGIIIKEFFVGEANKQLVLFLKDIGKIKVSARGARNTKSKLLAGTQLFTYADFVIYKGPKFYSITQVDIIESFYDLRLDYLDLILANYFTDFCYHTVMEGSAANDTLYLLLRSLQYLCKDTCSPYLVARVFEFKIMQQMGYTPTIDFCSECGDEIYGNFYFSKEGIVCSNCLSKQQKVIKISQAALHTLAYILCTETKKVFNIKTDDETLHQLDAASEIFMNYHLEAGLKSRLALKEYEG